MTSVRSDAPTDLTPPDDDASDELESSSLSPGARLAHVVGQHPAASLLGAFALGFAIARIARKLGGR